MKLKGSNAASCCCSWRRRCPDTLCVTLTRFWLHLFLSSFSWFGRNWCNCYLQSVMWSFLCILLDMSTGIIKSLRNFLNFEVSISRNACDYMFQGRLCGSMMFLPICYIDKYFSAISICNLMECQQSILFPFSKVFWLTVDKTYQWNITRFESFCDGGCEDKESFDDLLHDSLKEIS
jgi:hypothetical protein